MVDDLKFKEDFFFEDKYELNEIESLAKISHFEVNFHSNEIKWSRPFDEIFDLNIHNNVRTIMKYLHPQDQIAILKAFLMCKKLKKAFKIDIRIQNRKGLYHYYRWWKRMVNF